MAADTPKQYLLLNGRPLIEYALERLFDHPAIERIVLAVAPDDTRWQASIGRLGRERFLVVDGGDERSASVLNALHAIAVRAHDQDWALVHDAARPCLQRSDLDRLFEAVRDDAVGGLLATPVRDTMKRADERGRVVGTEAREGLWHALTPQLFRFRLLMEAMERAHAEGRTVTDESSAVELAGHAPRLVQGRGDNIKVTRPEDLALAAHFLRELDAR